MKFFSLVVLLSISVGLCFPFPENRPRVNYTEPKGSISMKEIEAMSLHYALGKISIPMYLSDSAINTSRRYSYCFKYLYDVPGLSSGVHDGWKVNYIQGYVAIRDRMYLFYRCDEKLD